MHQTAQPKVLTKAKLDRQTEQGPCCDDSFPEGEGQTLATAHLGLAFSVTIFTLCLK